MLELLYAALQSPFGVVVVTDNVQLLRQKLYAERRKHPMFECLALIPSPTSPVELWIVKKEQADDAAA